MFKPIEKQLKSKEPKYQRLRDALLSYFNLELVRKPLGIQW